MKILKSLIRPLICGWIKICKKRIRLLVVEQRGIETSRNFYPKKSFGYERLTLGIALGDVKISILVALSTKLRKLLRFLKIESEIHSKSLATFNKAQRDYLLLIAKTGLTVKQATESLTRLIKH